MIRGVVLPYPTGVIVIVVPVCFFVCMGVGGELRCRVVLVLFGWLFCLFVKMLHCVIQSGLKLAAIFLPRPLGYRHLLPHSSLACLFHSFLGVSYKQGIILALGV